MSVHEENERGSTQNLQEITPNCPNLNCENWLSERNIVKYSFNEYYVFLIILIISDEQDIILVFK